MITTIANIQTENLNVSKFPTKLPSQALASTNTDAPHGRATAMILPGARHQRGFRRAAICPNNRAKPGDAMNRLTAPLLIATLALSACGGRFSDSGWNPLGWLGGNTQDEGLAPEGGYPDKSDPRPGVPQVTSASWRGLSEGRLLVVTAMAPSKGYYDAGLVAETPSPTGRLHADADGTLRLRFVARPPAAASPYRAMPASPQTDQITAAVTLSHIALASIRRVQITGAGNAISISK